ncbi:B3 domain-containing protein Os03g0212300-like [Lolium perenne]|uniref:B3 domain-containing protein Os03g0212300-like n=1 Tax=Lolium perenne TaxID=4522 RepID=UPI0021F51618|nr:B3 domain-containing protein Os03g0212300-like [Lolium perenne]
MAKGQKFEYPEMMTDDEIARLGVLVSEVAVQLREAGCGFCRWPVDVLFDRLGKMYLHTGWEKFARFHGLQVGCVLTFSYQDDEKMSVKVFDDTSCRRHYHGDDEENDD